MRPAGGPTRRRSFSKGFFEVAAAQNPKPKTVAIIAADAEFPHNAADGARKNAKAAGLQVVYDKTYPPNTTDSTPIVRAIDAANADIVLSLSYPPDAVGMVRAANEIGLKAKMFGGGLVGLQYATIKQQLGAQLNGIINYDFWEPAKTLEFPGVVEFLKKYQAAPEPKGSTCSAITCRRSPTPTCRYWSGGQRNKEPGPGKTGGVAARTIRSRRSSAISSTAQTASGSAAVLQVQFHDVKGSDIDQWKNDGKQTILWPPQDATGKIGIRTPKRKAGAPAKKTRRAAARNSF